MNGNRRRVIVYGDSLILAGVQAGLGACPDLEVISLDSSCVSLEQEIKSQEAFALVFDIAMQPDFPSSLLQQPGLLLIGVDPETHQALVWSGRQGAAFAAGDLINVIRTDPSTKKDTNSETLK